MADQIWQRRSNKAKQLILKMLSKDPSQRLSAEECLGCDWMVDSPLDQQDNEIGAQIISNLKTFHVLLLPLSSKTSSRQWSTPTSLPSSTPTRTRRTS